jgi:hypothetical protein
VIAKRFYFLFLIFIDMLIFLSLSFLFLLLFFTFHLPRNLPVFGFRVNFQIADVIIASVAVLVVDIVTVWNFTIVILIDITMNV